MGYIKKLFRNEQLFYCKKLTARLVWPEELAAAFDFRLNLINDSSVYGKNKKMHRHLLNFIKFYLLGSGVTTSRSWLIAKRVA